MKKKFKFIDSIVKKEIVGVTCETCAVKIAKLEQHLQFT
jgi:hypothetical protein